LDRRVSLDSIGRLKEFLQAGYYSRHSEEPIGSDFVFIDKVRIQGVNGVEFEVQVNYVGKDSLSRGKILGGGSGKTKISNKPAVIIFINSLFTPRTFTLYALGEKITNDILEVLEHELTHQADIFKMEVDPSERRTTLPSANELDEKAYYNNPAEVKAYMRSVFNEMETYLPSASKVFTVRQIMEGLEGGSKTWRQIVGFLTKENKKLILKGVYQAVQDWYDQHELWNSTEI
jgi:hypothetical protein